MMRRGRIEVICGSMFSGKTEELIRRLKRAKFARQNVEIFKPSVDVRYSEAEVVSHEGNAISSTPVDSSASILLLGTDVDVVGIDEDDVSYDMLFDKQYSGQIFMLDSVRDALGAALVKLGYSMNTTNESELEEAKDLLIQQKSIIQAYITDEMADKMIAGEGLMTRAYSGEAAYAMSESDDLSYAIPKEGSNKWSDGFVVLKTGKQKELAMKYIDFMCRQDISQRNMIETGYASPVIGTDADDDSGTEVFYAKQETLDRCEAFTYSKDVVAKYDEIWTELKVN